MTVELSVRFSWRKIGEVALDGQGKLKFPQAPARPGLYRFDVTGPSGRQAYIGETDTLDRRFQHYRTPGPSQSTNIRLNALMREIVKGGGSVSVAVVTDGVTVALDGGEKAARLELKAERVLLEHAAIYAARALGLPIINA